MKKTTTKKSAGPTIEQFQRAAIAYVNEQALDFGGIVESLDVDFHEVVYREMARQGMAREEHQSAETVAEITTTMDVAFAIGVAVGRSLGGVR